MTGDAEGICDRILANGGRAIDIVWYLPRRYPATQNLKWEHGFLSLSKAKGSHEEQAE